MIELMSFILAGVAAPVPTAIVERAMVDSAARWNSGDLNRFMRIYADDATFVTAKGLVRGKAAIVDRYRKDFGAGGSRRGRLTFADTSFRPIDATHFLMWARWLLTPRHGRAQTGMTTLLFERRAEGWRIVSDHSS